MCALIVVGGLPGTGKTTLSRALAADLRATYVRVDAIEGPLFAAGLDVGPLGYDIAREVARSNLALGASVVVDLVNPLPLTRALWTDLAAELGVPLTVFECFVPDRAQHRRQVEERQPDLPGQVLPTWSDVVQREYVPWDTVRDGRRVRLDMTDADAACRLALAVMLGPASADAGETSGRWFCRRDGAVPDDVATLLAELPEWFGLDAANAEYIEAARTKETWTVRDRAGRVIGVTLVDRHFPHIAEIHLTLVARAYHGQGVGTVMMAAIEADARACGVRLLEVKTLGPSHPDQHYARTRHFYERAGFWALEETDLWGDHNPCLIMVKPLNQS